MAFIGLVPLAFEGLSIALPAVIGLSAAGALAGALAGAQSRAPPTVQAGDLGALAGAQYRAPPTAHAGDLRIGRVLSLPSSGRSSEERAKERPKEQAKEKDQAKEKEQAKELAKKLGKKALKEMLKKLLKYALEKKDEKILEPPESLCRATGLLQNAMNEVVLRLKDKHEWYGHFSEGPPPENKREGWVEHRGARPKGSKAGVAYQANGYQWIVAWHVPLTTQNKIYVEHGPVAQIDWNAIEKKLDASTKECAVDGAMAEITDGNDAAIAVIFYQQTN